MNNAGQRISLVATAACVITIAMGLAAVSYGLSLPVYIGSAAAAQTAFMGWCNYDGQIDRVAGDRYFALFTDHYRWVDTGIGLILTGAALALLVLALRFTGDQRRWLRTPAQRWKFIMLGVGVIAWSWAATMNSLRVDFSRHYFPWCADSMGIPMFEITAATLLVAPVLVAGGWIVTLFFGVLPVPLDQWDQSRSIRSWIVSAVAVALILSVVALLVLVLPTSEGRNAPALVIAIYLLASTRAALLAHGPLSARHRDAVIN